MNTDSFSNKHKTNLVDIKVVKVCTYLNRDTLIDFTHSGVIKPFVFNVSWRTTWKTQSLITNTK